MKTMKRILFLLLTAAMALVLAGCSDSGNAAASGSAGVQIIDNSGKTVEFGMTQAEIEAVFGAPDADKPGNVYKNSISVAYRDDVSVYINSFEAGKLVLPEALYETSSGAAIEIGKTTREELFALLGMPTDAQNYDVYMVGSVSYSYHAAGDGYEFVESLADISRDDQEALKEYVTIGFSFQADGDAVAAYQVTDRYYTTFLQ